MIGASIDYVYIGPFIMLIFLLIHFIVNGLKQSDVRIITIVGLIGIMIDSAFNMTTIIIYNGTNSNIFPPLWIIAMWIGFAATMNYSMSWLKNNYKIGFLVGSIFGPLSYITGHKFNAITINYSDSNPIFSLSISWALAVPIIFYINDKLIINNKYNIYETD